MRPSGAEDQSPALRWRPPPYPCSRLFERSGCTSLLERTISTKEPASPNRGSMLLPIVGRSKAESVSSPPARSRAQIAPVLRLCPCTGAQEMRTPPAEAARGGLRGEPVRKNRAPAYADRINPPGSAGDQSTAARVCRLFDHISDSLRGESTILQCSQPTRPRIVRSELALGIGPGSIEREKRFRVALEDGANEIADIRC